MKIREFITEAEEAELDHKIRNYFKAKERKQQDAERIGAYAKKPGLIGHAVAGIQKGKRLYKRAKELVTGKKYYD